MSIEIVLKNNRVFIYEIGSLELRFLTFYAFHPPLIDIYRLIGRSIGYYVLERKFGE